MDDAERLARDRDSDGWTLGRWLAYVASVGLVVHREGPKLRVTTNDPTYSPPWVLSDLYEFRLAGAIEQAREGQPHAA